MFSTLEGDAQIRKKLYVPRVEDRNSNMRMLKISSVDDLITNSMNILEPALVDSNGNECDDGMILFISASMFSCLTFVPFSDLGYWSYNFLDETDYF